MESYRLIVAADQQFIRKLVLSLLNTMDFIKVIEIVDNGIMLIESCLEHKPEIILIDFNILCEVYRAIELIIPDVKIIFTYKFIAHMSAQEGKNVEKVLDSLCHILKELRP